MRYIIAATAFALVAGIALGFVVSRELDGSASAAPKAQAVEEQNLDSSGFIAVHEQGVADVNVLSMPPQPAPTGRLIELGTQAVTETEPYESAFVDVSDCNSVTLMATASTGSFGGISYDVSPDGVTEVSAGTVGGVEAISGGTASQQSIGPIVLPFMRVIVGQQPAEPAAVTAWIWCEP